MNREIRFRAWDGFNGQYWFSDKYESLFRFFAFMYELESGGNKITLEQFSGIIDKKGNPIYEGDIVTCWDDSAKDPSWGFDKIHTGFIEYIPNCFCLKIPGKLVYDTPCIKRWEQSVSIDLWCNAENIEVIGNIFEHPHLLEKGALNV